MPIRNMMRRWNGPIGNRSSRLPAFTEVDMISLPFIIGCCGLASLRTVCRVFLVQSFLRCRVAVPVERRVMRRDHHAFGVEMIVKALGAAFAPDAAVVDAAPR